MTGKSCAYTFVFFLWTWSCVTAQSLKALGELCIETNEAQRGWSPTQEHTAGKQNEPGLKLRILWTAKHMFLTPFLPVSCHGPGLPTLRVDDTNSVWAPGYPMCVCAYAHGSI